MYLKDLKLWNFRSYEQLDLSFSEGITILTGENGQGKTNVIEAIYLLCTGKSHRTARENDMILHERAWARVRGESRQKDGRHTVDMVLARGQKRRILVNGLAISHISEMLGQLSGVIFFRHGGKPAAEIDARLYHGHGPLRQKRVPNVQRVRFTALAQKGISLLQHLVIFV